MATKNNTATIKDLRAGKTIWTVTLFTKEPTITVNEILGKPYIRNDAHWVRIKSKLGPIEDSFSGLGVGESQNSRRAFTTAKAAQRFLKHYTGSVEHVERHLKYKRQNEEDAFFDRMSYVMDDEYPTEEESKQELQKEYGDKLPVLVTQIEAAEVKPVFFWDQKVGDGILASSSSLYDWKHFLFTTKTPGRYLVGVKVDNGQLRLDGFYNAQDQSFDLVPDEYSFFTLYKGQWYKDWCHFPGKDDISKRLKLGNYPDVRDDFNEGYVIEMDEA